jgi:hypothetical protein
MHSPLQITLPIRFLLLTAHFVMILAVLFNVQATTINLTYPARNPNLNTQKATNT